MGGGGRPRRAGNARLRGGGGGLVDVLGIRAGGNTLVDVLVGLLFFAGDDNHDRVFNAGVGGSFSSINLKIDEITIVSRFLRKHVLHGTICYARVVVFVRGSGIHGGADRAHLAC